ncbi:hypothetical protein MCAP1_003611 [Malassezia caprae]|uniref:Fungal lipase-type domain-containing protein n=1 Tax=Malassezia caprae TaxID=1381934 RepID=A0AAF0EAF6_9BASI|nr:hypothetical protein MCAP1_003611 [Malassezia caprae]
MRFFAGLIAIVAASTLVAAAPHKNQTMMLAEKAKNDKFVDAPTSHADPQDLPVKVKDLQMAAAFASQTYCLHQNIGTKVGDGEIVWTTGDGWINQRATIINSKSLGLVISFQGTSPTDVKGWIEDFSFLRHYPDARIRAKLESGSLVETGFQKAYMGIADDVIGGIKQMTRKYNKNKITVVGHSLGAAMAEIAAVHIKTVWDDMLDRAFVYGLPRVGNVHWANSVDNLMKGQFYYVFNGKDVTGHVPPRSFGYQHPSGQIWINPSSSNHWKFYPGQENINGQLSEPPTLDIVTTHLGSYFGTLVGWGPVICPAEVNNYPVN